MTMKVKVCRYKKRYPIYYKITKHRSLSSLYYTALSLSLSLSKLYSTTPESAY
jgi:hypothetical protein